MRVWKRAGAEFICMIAARPKVLIRSLHSGSAGSIESHSAAGSNELILKRRPVGGRARALTRSHALSPAWGQPTG